MLVVVILKFPSTETNVDNKWHRWKHRMESHWLQKAQHKLSCLNSLLNVYMSAVKAFVCYELWLKYQWPSFCLYGGLEDISPKALLHAWQHSCNQLNHNFVSSQVTTKSLSVALSTFVQRFCRNNHRRMKSLIKSCARWQPHGFKFERRTYLIIERTLSANFVFYFV